MKNEDVLSQKPTLESISPNFGSSYTYQQFDIQDKSKHNIWHYHPEVELVYVNGGSGRRLVGSNLSHYTWGTLIMVGGNLPHCPFTDRYTGHSCETVIHMNPDFLGPQFFDIPEMGSIKRLFKIAEGGVVFSGKTKVEVGQQMESMAAQNDLKKLLTLLEILNTLSTTEEYRILNAEGFALRSDVEDNERINQVFNYVKKHFAEEITLEDMAGLTSMTIPSFCRYFKKITNKTFTQFVNEFRLVHASRLLLERPMTITEVCFESGFKNFSHFNKRFKAFTGQTPSEYRKQVKNILD